MKKTINALKFPIVFLLIISSFIACDKDFSVLESDVLGKGNANFGTNQISLPISAYNKKLSALQINNLGFSLLGFFDDPEFGQTTASIVAQVIPTAFNPDFGDNPVIDSVILSVPYVSKVTGSDNGNTTYSIKDSLYGDSEAKIKLTIYHNNYFLRNFNPNSTNRPQNYFSKADNGTTDNFALTENNTINFDDHVGDIVKDITFIPSGDAIKTTVGEGEDAVTTRSVPALRIHLNESFWKSAIIDHEGQPELSNSSNFYDYFRGLYFKAEPENLVDPKGNMVLMNFASSDASVIIYYSKGADDARTQSTYTLNFRGNRLNTFINNYDINFTDGDPDLGDETLYLKGTEGSMTIIDLFGNDPDALDDFINDFRKTDDTGEFIKDNTTGNFILKKLINEAQLVVYEDESLTTDIEDYHKYDRVYAYDIKNNRPTVDYTFDPTENTTEPFNSKVIHLSQRNPDQKKYKIRLTEHLNNILLRDSTNTKIGLVLSTNVNNTASAQILNSSNDDVTGIPAAAILAPRGTILHGSNENVDPADRRMKLNVFFTEPENN
ncbi:DUF4270 domain-containing protein [Flavivirga spongiicola]|uniref:DUF4270 domain-containing protein n=1 Tax=Flavivirga spongiicola TaxID=421621 RepID=A0ABU7XS91_9FLAO|nr:DUF4270 domain-containing protein [Flavivirga sp. MEBiC05379]MDO5978620.1 DUF4270 domain-containing protein [Flavivirga sp. MEBiC05379]